jgi:hypothetical protein
MHTRELRAKILENVLVMVTISFVLPAQKYAETTGKISQIIGESNKKGMPMRLR